MQPKVSIILTSFNHEKYIREAIDSVLEQTFTNFELIIWDDASSDNSWKIINNYSDPRVKAFRNDKTRRGVYGLNTAIKEVASGDYIAIQHSDDVWELNKLERQVKYLGINPKIGAVFTNALAIDEEGLPFDNKHHFYYNIFNKKNRSRHEWLNYFFYHANALCHPSVLIRKQCYIDCGCYRYGLSQLPDFDMWIRLCLKYEIYVLSEKLVKFRVRERELNTSGDRPENRIRFFTEYYQVLSNFLKLNSFEEFVTVFPEVKKYHRENGFIPGYVLSMLSLESKTSHIIQAFGIISLLNLLWNNDTSAKVKELYHFDYRDLIKITGKYDIFYCESAVNLKEALAERDGQIDSYVQVVAERDEKIESLNKTITERDAQIASLNQTAAERDAQIVGLNQALAERDGQIAGLNRTIAILNADYKSIITSTSWRVTKPLRSIGHQLKRTVGFFKL